MNYDSLQVKALLKKGNLKIGKNTLIFNLSSATDCVMRDSCEHGITGRCYAMKPERQYPAVLPYRRRQSAFWLQMKNRFFIDSNIELLDLFVKTILSYHGVKFIRFNESGEISHTEDIMLLDIIAERLKPYDIKCYTYSHNYQVIKDYKRLYGMPESLVINVSDGMIPGFNCFMSVPEIDRPGLYCTGGKNNKCMETCNLCGFNHGKTVYVKFH